VDLLSISKCCYWKAINVVALEGRVERIGHDGADFGLVQRRTLQITPLGKRLDHPRRQLNSHLWRQPTTPIYTKYSPNTLRITWMDAPGAVKL
jgi:hypothetical protein